MGDIFPDKRVFITGAGSGLGLALARKFATVGWRVAVTDIDADRAADGLKQVQAAGGDGFAMACDVSSVDALQSVHDRLARDWSGVDVVINNAGVAVAGTVAETPLSDWDWIIDINLMGVVRGCRVFAPMLAQQGAGHIVNIASLAAIAQGPGMASYNVTKIGVVGLSESLRAELKANGVGVSVVCPSFIQTNLMESFRTPDPHLKHVANKLISTAKVSADEVAQRIYRGVMRKRFMIIPHADARWLYRFKRFAPELLFRILSKQASKFINKSGPKSSQS